ncbi:MAG: helix-turn-helix domain-containing protein [Bifidobacteriaceae bacterium]|jgi:predicted transcriptional regulator|nr:helix-turn-helix domain-containing protein [Bifidobacteriaceae bacterium]
MREFATSEEVVTFCRALSSRLRLDILRRVAAGGGVSLGELAQEFGVSRGAITQNTRVLVDADLVELRAEAGKRGTLKRCFLKEDAFHIALNGHLDSTTMYLEEIPVGQFSGYRALPTCGVATSEHLIGVEDDPRYFDSPERAKAGIVWLTEGHLTYRLPNYLEPGQRPVELQLSFEISSEAPGVAETWPSDIHFFFNDRAIGTWTSPGDFGEVRGAYTPDWWYPNWNQYGLLKLLSINRRGTYIDGGLISDVTIDDLALDSTSDMAVRFAVGPDGTVGGMTLFGRGFGNYNQDIKFRLVFAPA